MPRVSARLQGKCSQSEVVNRAAPKQSRQNETPGRPHSANSAISTSNLPSTSFTDDMISRLANAVTQRLQQEQSLPLSSTPLSTNTFVREIPAASPSIPPCPPSTSIPSLESAVQSSVVATQPAFSPGEPSDPFISSSLSIDAHVFAKRSIPKSGTTNMLTLVPFSLSRLRRVVIE